MPSAPMPSATSTPTSTPLELLSAWVGARAPAAAAAWFSDALARLGDHRRAGGQMADKDIYLALGYATRKLGKRDLELPATALAAALAARPGWDPSDWSLDQAARIAFILASHHGQTDAFKIRLEQLFNTADIGELIAFYRGLPLYPDAARHVSRAREGTRSAMQPIFEAVAHRNPFPMEQFDENAWNHMVLKALFVGSRLAPIQGLDRRANPRLMRMLCDYAHERWAAGRPVSPELWRCVGPYADARALDDLARVFKTGGALERRAAVLALTGPRASGFPGAPVSALLSALPGLDAAAKTQATLTWSDIAADVASGGAQGSL